MRVVSYTRTCECFSINLRYTMMISFKFHSAGSIPIPIIRHIFHGLTIVSSLSNLRLVTMGLYFFGSQTTMYLLYVSNHCIRVSNTDQLPVHVTRICAVHSFSPISVAPCHNTFHEYTDLYIQALRANRDIPLKIALRIAIL